MRTLIKNTLTTRSRNQMLDITREVVQAISDSGIQEGLCILNNPHTTAALTINENADPDVTYDMEHFLSGLIPRNPQFRHGEGNSDSHIKTTLTGPGLHLIIHQGRPVLGTWQGIYFCEYDGPRTRHYYIKCIEG